MDLHPLVEQWEIQTGGKIYLAAKDLDSGKALSCQSDEKCATASVIKFPIAIHVALSVYEGSFTWDRPLLFTEENRTPGSGVLKDLSNGISLSLFDVCTLMICMSDNSATNMVIDLVGVESVNERMRSLGCQNTELFRKVYSKQPPKDPDNARFGLGVTTPQDQIRLLELLHSNEIGNVEVCECLRSMMYKQHYRDGIPRNLGVDVEFWGKSGAIDHCRNDIGIVKTKCGMSVAMAIFCQDITEILWSPDNKGLLAIASISEAIIRGVTS